MLADLRRVPPVFPSAGENARCGWGAPNGARRPYESAGGRRRCGGDADVGRETRRELRVRRRRLAARSLRQ